MIVMEKDAIKRYWDSKGYRGYILLQIALDELEAQSEEKSAEIIDMDLKLYRKIKKGLKEYW